MQPHRWQPTRLSRPWDSPGKSTGVGCHFLLQCMKVKSESEVAQSCPTLSDPMGFSLDLLNQNPPSMGFSRQEYWSGVPLPSPTSTSKKMVFLRSLSTFKIVCICSLRSGGTNTSLGVAPGGSISVVPAGHCLTLPLWAREDGSGPLEDAVLSAKSVGQIGSSWSAFLLLSRSLRGELPPKNTPAANVPL